LYGLSILFGDHRYRMQHASHQIGQIMSVVLEVVKIIQCQIDLFTDIVVSLKYYLKVLHVGTPFG